MVVVQDGGLAAVDVDQPWDAKREQDMLVRQQLAEWAFLDVGFTVEGREELQATRIGELHGPRGFWEAKLLNPDVDEMWRSVRQDPYVPDDDEWVRAVRFGPGDFLGPHIISIGDTYIIDSGSVVVYYYQDEEAAAGAAADAETDAPGQWCGRKLVAGDEIFIPANIPICWRPILPEDGVTMHTEHSCSSPRITYIPATDLPCPFSDPPMSNGGGSFEASCARVKLLLAGIGYNISPCERPTRMGQPWPSHDGFWECSEAMYNGDFECVVHYDDKDYIPPHCHDMDELFRVTDGGAVVYVRNVSGAIWERSHVSSGSTIGVPALVPHCLVAHNWKGLTMHSTADGGARRTVFVPETELRAPFETT